MQEEQVSKESYIVQHCELIEKVIRNKIKEKYEGFWLGVDFNDAYILDSLSGNEYKTRILDFISTPESKHFSKIFLIGSTPIGNFDEIDL